VVSNLQSFIDQATDQWRDCFNACSLKDKSKHFECVMCFSVTVVTFIAYVSAVLLHLQNSHHERWAILLQFSVQKVIKTQCNVIAKIKRVQFFLPHGVVQVRVCVSDSSVENIVEHVFE